MGHRHGEDCCGGGSADRAELAMARLKAAGLRITEARRALLRALAQSKVPLAVEELHRRVGAGRADRVTLYRSLEAFEAAGIVRRHPLEKGRTLYALGAEGHHHHHLICKQCGAIERLPTCDTETIEAAARARGYTTLSHVLEITGTCPTCRHA